ncbi:MAG: mechanosensitive ion channel domain-containing protein [Pirellulaceae bacterium]
MGDNENLDEGATDAITQLSGWYEQGSAFLLAEGPGWAARILGAVLLFAVGWMVSCVARSLLIGAMTRTKLDDTLAKFLANLAYSLMVILVVVAALNVLGVDTTSVAAMLAAAGLAVGLALQGQLSNFAAGVIMIMFRLFRVGDFIEAGGTAGIVEEIKIFHTQLRSLDNKQLILPNSSITSGLITNYSAKPTRRIDLTIGCGYDDDLRAVKQFLNAAVQADTRVLADPEPEVRVMELGANSVDFTVRVWVNSPDWWPAKCDLTEAIKLGFDEHGFNIPYPQSDVYLHRVDTEKAG